MRTNTVRRGWLLETVNIFQAAAGVRVSSAEHPPDATQLAVPAPATPIEGLVLELLRFRWAAEAAQPCRMPERPSEYTRLVYRATRLIEQRYAECLTYGSIGRELGCDAEHLERCFRRMTGATLHQRLRRVRLERAANAIARGTKVEAAALMVGYRTKAGFLRAFRQEYGITPTQLRGGEIRRV